LRDARVVAAGQEGQQDMGINTSDLAEVETLCVGDPAEAPSLLGKTFLTPWFQMDKDRSDSFERGTYLDQHPHGYGGEAGYGDGLVEGFHLLGMLDFLMNHSLYSTADDWMAWNYGLDHVRFVTVIRDTDQYRIRGSVKEVVDRGEQGHLLVLDLVGEVKGREKPGFVATLRVLWTTAP